jgi:capsular exopolysaccharide synthesis family protein
LIPTVPSGQSEELATSSKGVSIDVKRIVYQALRYWYFILLSLLLCLTFAYLKNRYAVRVYPITASIIIKETEETGGAELLYKNSLIDPYRNYLNELYIIKSYPLIQNVLEDLNFGVSFYREGNFLTTEAYGGLPFSAKVIDSHEFSYVRFQFVPLNEKQFQLFSIDSDNTKSNDRQTFSFGNVITYRGLDILFTTKNIPDSYLNQPYIFLYQSPKSIVGSFVGKLSASWAEEGAGIVELAISGPNPQKEIDFLNGLISRYQKYDLDKKNEIATRTIEFINGQLEELSDSLYHVESILEQFKNANLFTNAEEEAQRLYEKLEGLDLQKTEFLIHSNYYDYLTEYIQKSNNLDLVIAPSSVGIEDGILTALISTMVNLQLELKLFGGKGKIENPLFSDKELKLDEIKKDILEAVKNIHNTKKIRHEFLLKQINLTESQLNRLPSSQRKFISIKRNYSLLDNLYTFLLQKKSEASISRASSVADIAVVNPPMLSGGAISPNTSRNYMLAGFLGLFLPFSVLIILEFLNTKVQSREDVERIVKMPFIGGVGHRKEDDRLVVIDSPKSAIAESFRALRSNLNYFLARVEKPIVVVSSSISGEGKTFTTINLASVVAMSGKKTIIIGADLRKPRIFSDFNLSNEAGLSTYLAGLSDFNAIVQTTRQENLFVVSGGPVPPNPAELLMSTRMLQFIEEAKEQFDYIIIDTPPLAIVADALALTSIADHTIFIVRQNYTPKLVLHSVKDSYESKRIGNISLLLNDIYKSGPGYGYGYDYGYGYGAYSNKNGYGYYTE